MGTGFDSQTISLDLSEYKYVEILYAVTAYTFPMIYIQSTGKISIGNRSIMAITPTGDGNYGKINARIFSVSTSGITFEDGKTQVCNSSTRTVSNNNCVPYKVIGYK